MKYTPLLFRPEMIQAMIREAERPGSGKSQTRRILNPQPQWQESDEPDGLEKIHGGFLDGRDHHFPCPYGQPGDLIWCKETHRYYDWTEDGLPWIQYRADHATRFHDSGEIPEEWGDRLTDVWSDLSRSENYDIDGAARDQSWRPSIHMPRWASRLTLLLTEVRVQRVQDISDEDAKAEGADPQRAGQWDDGSPIKSHRTGFVYLWQSINGKKPGCAWEGNPWVWCLSYRPILANVDAVIADPGRYGIGEAA